MGTLDLPEWPRHVFWRYGLKPFSSLVKLLWFRNMNSKPSLRTALDSGVPYISEIHMHWSRLGCPVHRSFLPWRKPHMYYCRIWMEEALLRVNDCRCLAKFSMLLNLTCGVCVLFCNCLVSTWLRSAFRPILALSDTIWSGMMARKKWLWSFIRLQLP